VHVDSTDHALVETNSPVSGPPLDIIEPVLPIAKFYSSQHYPPLQDLSSFFDVVVSRFWETYTVYANAVVDFTSRNIKNNGNNG
jgi:hypothetical protein